MTLRQIVFSILKRQGVLISATSIIAAVRKTGRKISAAHTSRLRKDFCVTNGIRCHDLRTYKGLPERPWDDQVVPMRAAA